MAEETMTESAPVETPETESAEQPAETEEVVSTGEEEESPTSDNESAPEGESVPASDAAKKEGSDSEERATETAKRLAIENRQIKRQLRQIEAQMKAQKPPEPELKKPVKPSFDDFLQFDDPKSAYEKAMGEFENNVEKYALEKGRREQAEKSEQEAKQKEINNYQKEWNKRSQRLMRENPDFNWMEAYDRVQPTSPMLLLMEDSDVGPELLNYFDENPDIADEIRELSPGRATRKIRDIEIQLANQIKGIKPKPSTAEVVKAVKGGPAVPARPKSTAELLYGD